MRYDQIIYYPPLSDILCCYRSAADAPTTSVLSAICIKRSILN